MHFLFSQAELNYFFQVYYLTLYKKECSGSGSGSGTVLKIE